MMRTISISFVLFFIGTILAFGQNIHRISGVVKDTDGASLPYVNITFSSHNNIVVNTVTDDKGFYSVELNACDTCNITCNYMGYIPFHSAIANVVGDKTCNILMQEDPKSLTEVVVNGVYVTHDTEKSMYYPMDILKRSADSGIRLLYNMMIPELIVDRKSGSSTTTDHKTVTYCINGLVATANEIKAIRPKDLVRIDFYPTPKGRFSSYESVVDFVVKYIDKGGYVQLNTVTNILAPKGEYSPSVKWHNGLWDFHTVFDIDYVIDHKSGTSSDECIDLSPVFSKHSEVENYTKKSVGGYFLNKSTYSSDNLSLSFSPGFKYSRTPNEDATHTISYIPNVIESEESSANSNSLSFGPVLTNEVYWCINGNNDISFNMGFEYTRNTYDRRFIEKGMANYLYSGAEEDMFDWSSRLSYITNLAGHGDYLTFSLGGGYTTFNETYVNDMNNRQSLLKSYVDFGINYDRRFARWLSLHAGIVARKHYSKQNSLKQDDVLLLPELSANIGVGNNGRIVISNRTNYVSPLISWKNSASQVVNQYEVLRGNESLPYYINYWPSVSYSQSIGDVMINAYSYAQLSSKSIRDKYYVDNNKLIHTFNVSDAFFQSLSGLGATVFCLDRSLQFSGYLSYNVMRVNDDKNWYLRGWSFSLDAMYSFQEMSVSAYYISRQNTYGDPGSAYYKTPATYGISFLWTHKNYSLGLDTDNFLNTRHYESAIINCTNYSNKRKDYKLDYYPSLVLHFSVGFDFGHKKINKTDMQLDKSISNGILRSTR